AVGAHVSRLAWSANWHACRAASRTNHPARSGLPANDAVHPFVAVEERTVMQDGKPRRVQVPVEMPEGVSYEGIMGDEDMKLIVVKCRQMSAANAQLSGFSGGVTGGIRGARIRRAVPLGSPKSAVPPPAPPPPPSSAATMLVEVEAGPSLTAKPAKPADK